MGYMGIFNTVYMNRYGSLLYSLIYDTSRTKIKEGLRWSVGWCLKTKKPPDFHVWGFLINKQEA